jgi:hypothetical protein
MSYNALALAPRAARSISGVGQSRVEDVPFVPELCFPARSSMLAS